MAKPYMKSLGWGIEESFLWTETQKGAFKHIKEALLKASALALSDISKPFQLFINERVGVAKGVLTQYFAS